MKTRTVIEGITHDDLVNLFSTACYGSSYLDSSYDEAVECDEGDCHEDVIAKILLNGGSVIVTDYYAEGCQYGTLPRKVDDVFDGVSYTVTLKDIEAGLSKAADGTFNSQSEAFVEDERRFARKAFVSFQSEACDFDLTYAECLMQIILFNEIIYG